MSAKPSTLALVFGLGLALLIAVACTQLFTFDRATWLGVAIGGGVGLLNLVVSSLLMARAFRSGTTATLQALIGGFIVRLVVLVALVLTFQKVEAVNETALALSFLVLFFVYVALEVVMVERVLRRTGRTA